MTDKSLLDAKKAANSARLVRTEAYAEKVRREFALTVNQILALNKTLPTLDEGVMYSFDGASKRIQDQVEFLLRRLHSVAVTAIENGVSLEWKQAEEESNKLISSLFGKKVMSTPEFSSITSHNTAALNAFMKRHENGMDLSSRVWKSVVQLREEMEVAMTVAIGEGESAAQMSRKVRQYLNDPDLMFRRFRYKIGEDADGNPVYGRKWKKRVKDPVTGKVKFIDYDRDSYKTGSGVYKSSARNAMRVARSETNNAYRASDHERWIGMDFVLGIHVELSKKHPKEDICDKLEGDYPKDFNLTGGWHPQCFCVITPILCDEDEMRKKTQAALRGERYVPKGKKIRSCPEGFNKWVRDNKDKIAEVKGTAREPYFVRDNARMVDEIIDPSKKRLSALERAAIRHEERTPQDIDKIQRKWVERAAVNMLERAHEVGNDVQGIAETIAKKYGATVTPINYKSVDSIVRKVMTDRIEKKNPSLMPKDLKDVVRNTIVADGALIEKIIAEIGGKHKSQNTPLGYTGHIVNVPMKNGVTAEIQVNTAKMIYAKEPPKSAKAILGEALWNKIFKETGVEGGLGHKYYEQHRILDPNSDVAKQIAKMSNEYYSHFRRVSPLEIAAKRHAARTEEQIAAIKAAAAKRANEHRIIKTAAANIVKVASGYGEVDYSKLQKYIDAHDLDRMKAETKVVGQQIFAMRKAEQALSDLIPDMHKWHQQFTIAELQGVHDAVEKKLAQWAGLSLAEQQKKLKFEAYDFLGNNMNNVQSKYKTWKVSQVAYIKELDSVNYKIAVGAVVDKVLILHDYLAKHPKANKLLGLVSDVESEIAKNASIADIEAKLAIAEKDYENRLKSEARKAKKKMLASGSSSVFDNDAYSQDRKDNAVWCKSISESHSKFDAQGEDAWNDANAAEKKGWQDYTAGSGHMNRPLRGYRDRWGWGHYEGVGNVTLDYESGEDNIRALHALIERHARTQDIWLQRGNEDWAGVEGFFGIKGLAKTDLTTMVGKEVVDWSFMSCGSAKGTGFSGTIFNIYCPKGTKMIYAANHSLYKSENETILQLGTKFRITKVEVTKYGNVYVDMEVIGYVDHPLL